MVNIGKVGSGLSKLFAINSQQGNTKLAKPRKIPIRMSSNISNTNKKDVLSKYQLDKVRQLQGWKSMQNQLSPNTQMMLKRLMTTQNKSMTDDMKKQRIQREQKIIESAGSLLNTPYIFNKYQMDITGVKEDNILMAPNTFIENPNNNILRTNKLNILQTREAGNNLTL